MADLHLVLDPASTDLTVNICPPYPVIFTENTETVRLANSFLSYSGKEFLVEFNLKVPLTDDGFDQLYSLLGRLHANKVALQNPEVVVYNLVEPFRERAAARTRFIVPSTSPLKALDNGDGTFDFSYYVALQGQLLMTNYTREGCLYYCDLSFKEGTKLTSADE